MGAEMLGENPEEASFWSGVDCPVRSSHTLGRTGFLGMQECLDKDLFNRIGERLHLNPHVSPSVREGATHRGPWLLRVWYPSQLEARKL